MERIGGVVADTAQAARRELDRAARARAGAAIPEALAALHGADLESTGLSGQAVGAGHGARQVRRWSRQWTASRTRDLPAIDEATRRLGAAIPGQPETTLVHGDYTPNNLLLTPRGEVAGILDWEMWTLGDPIADVAWLGIWWPPSAARSPLAEDPPSAVDGAPTARELLDAYARASGRELDRLTFWTALSYWKLAIIIEGIYRRWCEDPSELGRERAERLRPRADAMAQFALETLTGLPAPEEPS
jgi:aminoglycoside phosphotransferase (APT) family kinase protein